MVKTPGRRLAAVTSKRKMICVHILSIKVITVAVVLKIVRTLLLLNKLKLLAIKIQVVMLLPSVRNKVVVVLPLVPVVMDGVTN